VGGCVVTIYTAFFPAYILVCKMLVSCSALRSGVFAVVRTFAGSKLTSRIRDTTRIWNQSQFFNARRLQFVNRQRSEQRFISALSVMRATDATYNNNNTSNSNSTVSLPTQCHCQMVDLLAYYVDSVVDGMLSRINMFLVSV